MIGSMVSSRITVRGQADVVFEHAGEGAAMAAGKEVGDDEELLAPEDHLVKAVGLDKGLPLP